MARPTVLTSFTATYQRQSTQFRLVQDDASVGGSFTLENASLDAVGGTAWALFLNIDDADANRSVEKLTPNILAGLLDAVYGL